MLSCAGLIGQDCPSSPSRCWSSCSSCGKGYQCPYLKELHRESFSDRYCPPWDTYLGVKSTNPCSGGDTCSSPGCQPPARTRWTATLFGTCKGIEYSKVWTVCC